MERQLEETERESNRRNIWNNNDGEFPPNNATYQTADPGSSENTKKDKYLKTKQNKTKNYTEACIFKPHKIKEKLL